MASENPPIEPARSAHRMLLRVGNAPCCAKAIVHISANAHTCEKAVSTKALARREPYPPAKSDAPHMKTAIMLYTAGANWLIGDTTVEVNTMDAVGRKSGNEWI